MACSFWLCCVLNKVGLPSLFWSTVFKVSSIKYLAKALSTFHQINAYEEDSFLILDMCASDDGQAITNYNIQNLRKSGEALDKVSRICKGQQDLGSNSFHNIRVIYYKCNAWVAFDLAEHFLSRLKGLISHQVYNTLCRIFPRRFILPLNVDHDTPYNQNLNKRPNSTATSVRIAKNKVGKLIWSSCINKEKFFDSGVIRQQPVSRSKNRKVFCLVILYSPNFHSSKQKFHCSS